MGLEDMNHRKGILHTVKYQSIDQKGRPCTERICLKGRAIAKERNIRMSAPKVHIILPDLWAHCPFPVKLHDNSEEVISQSQKWFDNSCTTLFAPSSPYATARETVDSAGVGQMIAYCFPNASEKRFRILCDLGFILFLLDDLGDEMVPAEWENVKIAVEDVLKTGKIAEQGVEGDLAQLFAG